MRNTMRGVLAGAAIATAVGLASPAHATIAVIGAEGDMNPSNYAAELRYAGIYDQTIYGASQLGPKVCNARAAGYSEDAIIHGATEDNYPATAEAAVAIVMGGEFHYCPMFEDNGHGAPSAPSQPVPTPSIPDPSQNI
jgi:hypothetical protein